MKEKRDESGAGPLSVIIIDDEPDVAAYLAAVLERRGHRAYTAASAAEGFELIKRVHPDVACIDIVMPEESGTALLRRIRADEEIDQTPVVFISALKPHITFPPDEPIDEPVAGPYEYIEKPPNADAFVATVEMAARSRRATT